MTVFSSTIGANDRCPRSIRQKKLAVDEERLHRQIVLSRRSRGGFWSLTMYDKGYVTLPNYPNGRTNLGE
jgi:hypothetical protein